MKVKAKIPCVHCKGKGTYNTGCSMCHDSTWDHYCDDEDLPCTSCNGTGYTIGEVETVEEP